MRPVTDLHPYRRCHHCSAREHLIETVHVATKARTWRCDDYLACARRVALRARAA